MIVGGCDRVIVTTNGARLAGPVAGKQTTITNGVDLADIAAKMAVSPRDASRCRSSDRCTATETAARSWPP